MISAVGAYAGNALAVRLWGQVAVKWAVPVVEESLKTGVAIGLGSPILGTHVVFALVEAFYDIARRSRVGFLGALLSLTGHTLFGLVTVASFRWTGSAWLGLTVGIAVHMAWNGLAMGGAERRSSGS